MSETKKKLSFVAPALRLHEHAWQFALLNFTCSLFRIFRTMLSIQYPSFHCLKNGCGANHGVVMPQNPEQKLLIFATILWQRNPSFRWFFLWIHDSTIMTCFYNQHRVSLFTCSQHFLYFQGSFFFSGRKKNSFRMG